MKNTFYMADPHFNVGDKIIVVEETSGLTGKTEYIGEMLTEYPDGIPGNSNPDITRFHGWRGTTNDIAVYALGARRVK